MGIQIGLARRLGIMQDMGTDKHKLLVQLVNLFTYLNFARLRGLARPAISVLTPH